jgi:putative Holliday junction resolvase
MGLPLHMSGEESPSSERARELAALVSSTLNIEVVFLDERLTSKIAENYLKEQGVGASKRRKHGQVDQIAAMQILQNYLDSIRFARRNLQT